MKLLDTVGFYVRAVAAIAVGLLVILIFGSAWFLVWLLGKIRATKPGVYVDHWQQQMDRLPDGQRRTQ